MCNAILEATPTLFTGWEAMNDERLLGAVKASEASISALQNLRQAQIDALRKREVSWAKIGEALGISRQAAWERFS